MTQQEYEAICKSKPGELIKVKLIEGPPVNGIRVLSDSILLDANSGRFIDGVSSYSIEAKPGEATVLTLKIMYYEHEQVKGA